MNTLRSACHPSVPGGSPALWRLGWPRWRWARAALRAPLLALVAALCVLVLLLAFQQVVRQGVERGESRNRAIAAHADGVWRCNTLRTVNQRAACRVQLDAAHAAHAADGTYAAHVALLPPDDQGGAAARTVAQVKP